MRYRDTKWATCWSDASLISLFDRWFLFGEWVLKHWYHKHKLEWLSSSGFMQLAFFVNSLTRLTRWKRTRERFWLICKGWNWGMRNMKNKWLVWLLSSTTMIVTLWFQIKLINLMIISYLINRIRYEDNQWVNESSFFCFFLFCRGNQRGILSVSLCFLICLYLNISSKAVAC